MGDSIVNTVLIALLQAITNLMPDMFKVWSADKAFFSASFSRVRNSAERCYIAIIDGKLIDLRDKIKSIVKCKCNKRF